MPESTVVEPAKDPKRTRSEVAPASEGTALARRAARALTTPVVTSSIALVYFAIDLVTDLRAGLPPTHVALEVVGLLVALAVLVGVLLRR